MAAFGTTDMAAFGTTCMAVQGIMDLVADNTIDSLYNWNRIKNNLVFVLFFVLLTPFTTIILGILKI
jgi:hypothetical protein